MKKEFPEVEKIYEKMKHFENDNDLSVSESEDFTSPQLAIKRPSSLGVLVATHNNTTIFTTISNNPFPPTVCSLVSSQHLFQDTLQLTITHNSFNRKDLFRYTKELSSADASRKI
jgi:hypothetical protein